MAAQLGRYDLVAEHDRTGAAPGGAVLRQVIGNGPVLILLDEVLVYVEKAKAVPEGDSTAGKQAMLFAEALTEAVNACPNAAMVYSLQASVGEAVGSEGLLVDLDKLVSPHRRQARARFRRRGAQASCSGGYSTTSGQPPSRGSRPRVRRAGPAANYGGCGLRKRPPRGRRRGRTAGGRIRAAYPFHPELLDLMFHRWGSLPSYQRTRGALQFLACAVNVAVAAREPPARSSAPATSTSTTTPPAPRSSARSANATGTPS